MRVMLTRLIVTTFALLGASNLLAQLDEDHFEVPIKFSQGRFVADRAAARLNLSPRFKQLLRSGITEQQLTNQLCDALDREFRLMPKPYFFTLTDPEKEQDLAGKLNNPGMEARREWNGSIRQFPEVEFLARDRDNKGGFNEHLERVVQRSAFAEWVNPLDDLNRPLQFRLRSPLLVMDLETPQLGKILDRESLLKLLKPVDRLPPSPAEIQTIILDFYTPRGLTPNILLKLDELVRSVSITDTARIARILLPEELKNFTLAQEIVYEALPQRVFVAFRKKGQEIMNMTLEPDSTKREIDLRELVIAAETAGRAGTFELPPLDANLFAQIQQRLLVLQHTASVFEFRPEEQLFDLVIDVTTPQKGAGTEANPVTGAAETPLNAPETTARPGAEPDVQTSPVAPAATLNPKRSANTPREQPKNYLGGGLEYLPGQGIRTLGTYQRINTFGIDLFGVEFGAMGSGFMSAHYARDYLFFGLIGRRLTVDFTGGTDFENRRLLDQILTDERRTGAAFRVDLELFRDLDGQQVGLFLQGSRETVRLNRAVPETARFDLVTNQNTIDFGMTYSWRRSIARHPLKLKVEPFARLGVALTEADPSFQKFSVVTQYHQLIAGPVELESRFQVRTASLSTPVYELPSLGGQDSVRGFRTDDILGGRLVAWQNELWFPVIGGGAPSKVLDILRRNVRIAAFVDVGAAHRLAPGLPISFEGRRQGTGLGLRVKYQGVVIETDWAYGFGSNQDPRDRGRFYFNFRLP